MRITVIGAILVVFGVAAGLFLLLALSEDKNGLDNRQDSDSQQDQFWQHGMNA
jgi:hypothetical protein